MTENSSEQQLADQARIAVLEGLVKAANAGQGDDTRAFAEAYAVLSSTAAVGQPAPWMSEGTYHYSDRRLDGRR